MPKIVPDPQYELIEPRPKKRGRQCGECGMKFEYNQSYAHCCAMMDCPMGWGPGAGNYTTLTAG